MSTVAKWIGLKIHQYELTFGLYMLEPWEKLILNSIFILFFGFFIVRGMSMFPDLTNFVLEKGRYYLSMENV
ncbi:hypothetical protein HDU84_006227 [Entophlyctis sp. JEL0112]|nr:hypothetical protein HDU84_006227 [Entophlyctis sp. JEL0112]